MVVPYDDRDENNQFVPKHTDDEILSVIGALDEPPTTGAIAGELEYDQSSMYRRLQSLEDEGKVESEKVGNANVWAVIE